MTKKVRIALTVGEMLGIPKVFRRLFDIDQCDREGIVVWT